MILGNSLDVFKMLLSDGSTVSFSAPTLDAAISLSRKLMPNKVVCVQKEDKISAD